MNDAQQKSNDPRIIIRIELPEGAKENIEQDCDCNGMTQVAMLSRLVEWFAEQPSMVKANILGQIPAEGGADAGWQVIKAMAAQESMRKR